MEWRIIVYITSMSFLVAKFIFNRVAILDDKTPPFCLVAKTFQSLVTAHYLCFRLGLTRNAYLERFFATHPIQS